MSVNKSASMFMSLKLQKRFRDQRGADPHMRETVNKECEVTINWLTDQYPNLPASIVLQWLSIKHITTSKQTNKQFSVCCHRVRDDYDYLCLFVHMYVCKVEPRVCPAGSRQHFHSWSGSSLSVWLPAAQPAPLNPVRGSVGLKRVTDSVDEQRGSQTLRSWCNSHWNETDAGLDLPVPQVLQSLPPPTADIFVFIV